MQFTTSTATATLLALLPLPLTAAAPAPLLEARVEPVIRSPFFTLRASTYERVEFNGAALTSYHTGAGRGWAVLHRGDDTPRTAYLNGTEAQLRANSGTLVFPFPAGEEALKLSAPGSGQPLEMAVGPGSLGLYVDSHGDDHELKINHRPQQAFYGKLLEKREIACEEQARTPVADMDGQAADCPRIVLTPSCLSASRPTPSRPLASLSRSRLLSKRSTTRGRRRR